MSQPQSTHGSRRARGAQPRPDSARLDSRLTVLHASVPGRLRVRSALLYRAGQRAARVHAALADDPRIADVRITVLTGSMVLNFDASAGVAAIIDRVRQVLDELAEQGAELQTLPPGRSAPPSASAVAAPHPGQRGTASSWHCVPTSVALRQLHVDPSCGLAAHDAATRLLADGPNRLPIAVRRSRMALLGGQFLNAPVLLLGVSAAVSLATGGIADAVVIGAVVLLNATIGYFTEDYAERTISALAHLDPGPVRVLRDRRPYDIPRGDVVSGDVLLLVPGMQIAADARLIDAERLSVDESALTGESLPVAKAAALLLGPDTPLADRRNMVYAGTLVSGGSARAVAVATGVHTEIGQIQALVGETRPPETPMQRQLGHMGTQLAWASTAICGAVFGIGLLRGYAPLAMLTSAISLAVAAVPEGLPTVATTTLALGMQRMRRRNALLRRLDAVETLGSVQVLCLDKTGTLTRNRMTAVEIRTADAVVRINDGAFEQDGLRVEPCARPVLARLLETVALCSDVDTAVTADGAGNGSATESALIEAARAAGIDIARLREALPRLRARYRSESRHYMATWHAAANDTPARVAVKGSPEQVLERAAFALTGAGVVALTPDLRERILRQNDTMAGAALRVLGVAYAEPAADDTGLPPLIWLGLVGMTDPPRSGMRELVQRFHSAGIRTVMITGDQSATAFAIGQELDLGHGAPLQVLDSTALERVPPELLTALVDRTHVYSRVSPAHKLRIVQALQRAGMTVAMTGDGINDSPALRAADIGVAMGAGSAAAREVADIVLADDNLHTLVAAIEKGRTIYANIRKSIHFLLATNLSEIELMLAGIALGLGQPLAPTQLLWINLVTDVLPALALALDPPAADVLGQAPRDPAEPIIRRDDFRRMGIESATITGGALAAYGYALTRYGAGPAAGTHAFMTLTLSQLLHAYSVRSEHSVLTGRGLPANRYLDAALGASLVAQLAAVFVPGLRALLRTTPLGPLDAAVIAGGAALPFLLNQLTKPGAAGKGSPS